MAIEFHCPYCTSAIRVKDNAAGKRGRCPRCEQQLIVPIVHPHPSAQQAAPAQLAPQVQQAPRTQAAPPEPPVLEPPSLEPSPEPSREAALAPSIDQPPADVVVPALQLPTDPAPPAAAVRSRRRRSSNRLAMILLAVSMLAVVIVAAVLWRNSQPVRLEGTLAGEFVSAATLSPVEIPASDIPAADDIRSLVLNALRSLPYTLKSQLVVTEFRGSDTGLQIRLIPTTNTAIVRVNPTDDEPLAAWLQEHASVARARRTADLQDAMGKFLTEYAASETEGLPISDPGFYRNHLGLAAHTLGFGYVVSAIADRQICPCVHEDDVGNLYFAVPADTTEFRLSARTLDDGRRYFPGNYTVRCDARPETVEVVEPGERAEPATTPGKETPAEPKSDDAAGKPGTAPMSSPMSDSPAGSSKSGGMFESEDTPGTPPDTGSGTK